MKKLLWIVILLVVVTPVVVKAQEITPGITGYVLPTTFYAKTGRELNDKIAAKILGFYCRPPITPLNPSLLPRNADRPDDLYLAITLDCWVSN